MKTTMIIRSTANPRRTTLAHLSDAEGLAPATVPAGATTPSGDALPQRTANPRRTTLVDAPAAG